ncbi:hypothetical protein [Pseudomonas abietaniphila]
MMTGDVPDQGVKMAEMYLDDIKGYWKALSAPAYQEFWDEYQRDTKPDIAHLYKVYRRLICAALLLNHQADKAAPLHGLQKGEKFIDLLGDESREIRLKLHACRQFANDAKHEMKRIQEASVRARASGFDKEGACEVFEIHMLSLDGELYEMCRTVTDVFWFWVGYFDGKSPLSFKKALAEKYQEI